MKMLNSFARTTALALLVAAPLRAQSAPNAVDPSVGVLIVAHGADASWNSRVDSLANAVRKGGVVRGPVGVSFLMGQGASANRFQNVVADLQKAGARQIIVVPALVSSHSGHYEQIRYLAGQQTALDEEMMHHLHMAGLEPVKDVPMVVTPALDNATELAGVLAARAKEIEPSPAGRALFLFGHGPNSAEDYAAWMANLRPVADSVKKATGFASVAIELVRDDAPAAVRAEAVKRAREIIGLQQAATGKDVIVVPILVSAGGVSQRKLPADLAGMPIVYTGEPLLLDTQLSHWVEHRVIDAAHQMVTTSMK